MTKRPNIETLAEVADRLMAVRSSLNPNQHEFMWNELTLLAQDVRRLSGTEPQGVRTCATCHAVLADGPQPAATYEPQAAPEIQNAGNEAAISDIPWAVNYLLEQIAAKFEAWDTLDLFRSEAASTVRSFKHDLSSPLTRPK